MYTLKTSIKISAITGVLICALCRQVGAATSAVECSDVSPDLAVLSTSDAINDVAKEIWSIEDETVNSQRYVHVVFGVAAAYGGWLSKETGVWQGRLFTGPSAAIRLGAAQVAQSYVIERDRERLKRLEQVVLQKIRRDAEKELAKFTSRKQEVSGHISDVEQAEKEGTPDSAGKSGSSREGDTEQLAGLAQSLRSDLHAMDEHIKELHGVIQTADAWSARACLLRNRLNAGQFAFMGAELMLGYGFDVATNPDKNPKSAVIGGVGINLSVRGVVLGIGPFLHQAGIAGVYLDAGISLFN